MNGTCNLALDTEKRSMDENYPEPIFYDFARGIRKSIKESLKFNKKKEVVDLSSVFPKCPVCEEGDLVPFSFQEDVFEKWKCTKCEYTLQKK